MTKQKPTNAYKSYRLYIYLVYTVVKSSVAREDLVAAGLLLKWGKLSLAADLALFLIFPM